jgi:hypothetical protein
MKTSINIAKCLRIFFGVTRTLTLLLVVLVVLVYTLMTGIHSKEGRPNYFPTVPPKLNLRLNEGAIELQTETSDPADIEIGKLEGTLKFNSYGRDPQLLTRVRWTTMPLLVIVLGSWFLLLGFLRRLCANIETGEMFSDNNLRLVRNIGLLLVISELVGDAMLLLSHHLLGSYLAQHATITGIDANLQSEVISQLGISGIVTGLLVLLIAEAFRQGLALKKESELTV